jgi:hypothetical protein
MYVSNMSDKELHQEIVGQWNATGKDFDEDEMNILIEELDRRSQRVDNVYMSEKRVHKSDKSIHEEKNT